MQQTTLTHRHVLPLVLMLAAASATLAAPVELRSGKPVEPPTSTESQQGREHRAGVQALVNGDAAKARSHFEAALKIDADHVPSLLGLAAVALAAGSAADADPYLTRAETLSPKAAEVILARGRQLQARGDLPGAEAAIKRAVAAAPGKLPPLLELGDFYMRSPERKADALKTYRQAVTLGAGNASAQYGLGVAAAINGQREEALAALDKAAAMRPKDASAPRAIGRLHLEAGAFDKALAAFDSALARQPKSAPLMLDRSDALLGLGRSAEAVKQLQAAGELAPNAVEIKVKLGDAHQRAGQWPQAEAQYLKAIEMAPKHPLAYNNLAWMTVERKGDAKKAVDWARQAVTLSPNSSPFHDTLGWAERAAGNLPAAVSSLKRAIELEPRIAGHHYHLGLVQAENKQPAEARAALKKALELDPRLPEAAKAQQLLKSLPPA